MSGQGWHMHGADRYLAVQDFACEHPAGDYRPTVPVLVVPVAGAREAIARAVEAHIAHMETYTLPALEPGFMKGWDHALRLLRRDAGFVAERAAHALAAVPPEGEEA